jgi:hypothetical protein
VSGAYVDVNGGYYASATPHPLTLMDAVPDLPGRVDLVGGVGGEAAATFRVVAVDGPQEEADVSPLVRASADVDKPPSEQ